MAPPIGKSNSAVIEELYRQPKRFNYEQAVRLLTWEYGTQVPIRTRAALSLAFPEEEITDLEYEEDQGFTITTTKVGLYGTRSPLPTFYTEELLHEEREDKCVLRGFYDLLSTSFYNQYIQAWSKYRLPISLIEKQRTQLLEWILSFAGISLTTAIDDNAHTDPIAQDQGEQHNFKQDELQNLKEEVIPYLGLFNQNTRSSLALETMLKDITGCQVEVEQFISKWVDIEEGQRSYLGEINHCLGGNAYLGHQVMDSSGSCRVHLAIDSQDDLLKFQENNKLYKKMEFLLKEYLSDITEVDVVLTPAKEFSGGPVLGYQDSCVLSVNSWFSGTPAPKIIPVNL